MSRAHANIVAGEGDESDSDDEDWLDDVDVAELTAEDIRAAATRRHPGAMDTTAGTRSDPGVRRARRGTHPPTADLRASRRRASRWDETCRK